MPDSFWNASAEALYSGEAPCLNDISEQHVHSISIYVASVFQAPHPDKMLHDIIMNIKHNGICKHFMDILSSGGET